MKAATEITTKVTGETLEDTNKVVIPETVSTIGLQEIITVVRRIEEGKRSRIIEKASPFHSVID